MTRELPRRLWIDTTVAVVGFALFVLTLFSPVWIEESTGLDPDRGSGVLEFGIPCGLLAVALLSAFAARRDYRRLRPAAC